jgi:hypothetical protein
MTINVDAVDGFAFGPLSHVSEKVREATPPLAGRDSTSAVMAPARRVRVGRSVEHRSPCDVGVRGSAVTRFAVSVRQYAIRQLLAFQATARTRIAGSKRAAAYDERGATDTTAEVSPMRVVPELGGFTDHCQAREDIAYLDDGWSWGRGLDDQRIAMGLPALVVPRTPTASACWDVAAGDRAGLYSVGFPHAR